MWCKTVQYARHTEVGSEWTVTADRRKTCTLCRKRKSLSNFYADPTGRHGVHSRCRPCVIRKVSECKARRKSADPIGYRASRTAERYGVRAEDILAYWSVPVCQSCGAELTAKNRRIDHCHDNGHVRGVLCHLCNIACAGEHNACISRLSCAISYLQRDLERRREHG